MENISLNDEDDNAPPELPDISVGSSVSTTMEVSINEKNNLKRIFLY